MRRVVVAIVAFLVIGALIFPSAGWDDAYISYWAAHALSTYGRIINVNGELVEQSSSLGFVLILAALRRLTGVDVSIVGRLSSIGFGVAAIWATARLGRQMHASAAQFSPVLVATSCYFVYWSFGGMEASLAALSGVLLLLVLIQVLDEGQTLRRLVLAAIACAAYVSARPESPLILTATLAGLTGVLVLRRRWHATPEEWEVRAPLALSAFAASCAAATGALVLFRLWYFGRLFPQPVYAKAHALSKQKVIDGLSYVLSSMQSEFLIIAVLSGMAAGLLIVRVARRSTVGVAETVTAIFLLASFVFIVMSGGDGMHGGRFFVPAIPMAAVLGVALLSTLVPPRLLRAAVTLWVLVQIGGVVAFARTESHSDPLWAVASAEEAGGKGRFHWFERANHDHRRYIPVVIALESQIARARVEQNPVTVLSGQSGFVLYHLASTQHGSIRYFDRFALATRDFIDCSISAGLPHTEWGLRLTVADYLRRLDRFQQQCGIPAPQFIFELLFRDLPPGLERALKQAGYAVTYLQTSDTVGRSILLPGQPAEGVYIAALQRLEQPDNRERGPR